MGKDKKIKLWALVMLIFVPTFGFGNIASNAVYLGPAADSIVGNSIYSLFLTFMWNNSRNGFSK